MKVGLCPDMPVMVNDWLSSTSIALMTPAEEGAYIRLLCHAWNEPDCTLPDDDSALAQLSRLGPAWCQGSGAKIRACFKSDPERAGRLYNAKQRTVRAAQNKRIDDARGQCAKMRAAKEAKRKGSSQEACQGSFKEALQDEQKSLANGLAEPLPSPVSRLPSPVSRLPSPDQDSLSVAGTDSLPPVEPPKGFPRSEAEALPHAAFVGCPEPFALKIWSKAMSRGGRDGRDIPIRNWRQHLATEWRYEEERQAKDLQRSGIPRGTGATSAPNHQPTAFTLKTQIEAIEDEMKAIKGRGTPNAHGWSAANKEDEARYRELAAKRKDVKAKLQDLT